MPPSQNQNESSQPTTKSLAIDQIRTDGGTQPRSQLHTDLVAEYAEDMRKGAEFPPVTVFFDGQEYWLADGFHRVHAKRATGAKEVIAVVHPGSLRDAILHSVGANAAHGLRRTNADKQRAVERMLRDNTWKNWSNREIARRCGVHHQLVGNLRNKLYSLDDPSSQYRIGADGRTINTTNIGKSDQEEGKSTKRQRIKKQFATPEPLLAQPKKVEKEDTWRLGKSHLLFCGDSESKKFQKHLPSEIALLLIFPRSKRPWLTEEPANVQNTLLFHTSYGEDLHLETLRGIIENCLSGTTDANDPIVMINLIDPSLFILIDELECACYCAEPDPQRCTDALTAWSITKQPSKKL